MGRRPNANIIYLPHISRGMLQANPQGFYVFGDNTARTGYGGQAQEMRGEPNALGVATKRLPTMAPDAFFSDSSEVDALTVACDLMRVVSFWSNGYQIFAPANGIGTERALLKEKAPKLYETIIETFREMSGPDFPWK